MANKNAVAPMHTRFQPGVSGNPGGRPKAKLTVERLRKFIDDLSFNTKEELEAIVESKTTPMIELQLASIMLAAAKTGDYSRMSALVDRLLGKVSDVVETHNHDYDVTKQNIAALCLVARNAATAPAITATDDE